MNKALVCLEVYLLLWLHCFEASNNVPLSPCFLQDIQNLDHPPRIRLPLTLPCSPSPSLPHILHKNTISFCLYHATYSPLTLTRSPICPVRSSRPPHLLWIQAREARTVVARSSIMTSQHRHPHLQQSQQSSQYYELSQSQNTNSLPPRQSSPAIYMQHHPTSSASPYSSSSLQQSYAAHSSATLVNPYQSGLLHNTLIPTARPGSSAVVRYPTTAQAGSPPPTYLPAASTSTASAPSSQAQIGVSSRIVNSLQSLVSLLEKQNAKLDKHDERLKRLNEGFDQLKTETTRCTEGIEAFSKTMSKKLKTMSEL